MSVTQDVIDWLLSSDEPWTRFRTRVDLLGEDAGSPGVRADRAAMLEDQRVLSLVEAAQTWGEKAFTRHNDADYPIYKMTLLADFGLQSGDPGIDDLCQKVMVHQSGEGAFQCLVSIPPSFGGDGKEHWTWMICDAPTLVFALLAMGYREDERVKRALTHLCSLAAENGYPCVCDLALGRFRGPGKKGDPCPAANILALRALSQAPETWDLPAVKNAAEMLLAHWAAAPGQKYYLFGVGSDYRKLKAPLVWYNLLHVCEALSQFPFLRGDPRLKAMTDSLQAMADAQGRYTAASMYKNWDGWSFANKKTPSPWLTFLAARILKRMESPA